MEPTTIEATTITPPDTGKLAKQGQRIVARAEALTVDSPASLEVAGTGLREIKTVRKEIADLFSSAIAKAHSAHKAMVAARNRLEAPAKEAEAVLKLKVSTYQLEEERNRRAEEERLRELARVEAEERQLAEAVAAEAAGNMTEAAEIIAEPIAAPVVVVQAPPKVAGVSSRETWKFRITDETRIPRDYLIPDEKKIGAHARSMASKASIPGVEFYPEKTISARSY